jgi:hypothetical protein
MSEQKQQIGTVCIELERFNISVLVEERIRLLKENEVLRMRIEKMTEIDIETRIELLIANYAAMIATLASIERRMNELQRKIDTWNS